jgi:hypothetical protein
MKIQQPPARPGVCRMKIGCYYCALLTARFQRLTSC